MVEKQTYFVELSGGGGYFFVLDEKVPFEILDEISFRCWGGEGGPPVKRKYMTLEEHKEWCFLNWSPDDKPIPIVNTIHRFWKRDEDLILPKAHGCSVDKDWFRDGLTKLIEDTTPQEREELASLPPTQFDTEMCKYLGNF